MFAVKSTILSGGTLTVYCLVRIAKRKINKQIPLANFPQLLVSLVQRRLKDLLRRSGRRQCSENLSNYTLRVMVYQRPAKKKKEASKCLAILSQPQTLQFFKNNTVINRIHGASNKNSRALGNRLTTMLLVLSCTKKRGQHVFLL